MLIEHSSLRPLDEFDIPASFGLVPFPFHGEFDPGPRREAKELERGVMWLHGVDGKCNLIKVSKTTPRPSICTHDIIGVFFDEGQCHFDLVDRRNESAQLRPSTFDVVATPVVWRESAQGNQKVGAIARRR